MRGELDFAAALRERVGLLGGLDAGVLERVYERVTLMPGAATLVATMRRSGAMCALVSGGFTFFTERVAARLDFDVQQANTLELEDGRIAGTVQAPILGREAKPCRSLGWCARDGHVVPVQGEAPDVLIRGLSVRPVS